MHTSLMKKMKHGGLSMKKCCFSVVFCMLPRIIHRINRTYPAKNHIK